MPISLGLFCFSAHHVVQLAYALGSCSHHFLFHFKPVVNFQVRGPEGEAREGLGSGQEGPLQREQASVYSRCRCREGAGRQCPWGFPQSITPPGPLGVPRGCRAQNVAFLPVTSKQAERFRVHGEQGIYYVAVF